MIIIEVRHSEFGDWRPMNDAILDRAARRFPLIAQDVCSDLNAQYGWQKYRLRTVES